MHMIFKFLSTWHQGKCVGTVKDSELDYSERILAKFWVSKTDNFFRIEIELFRQE